MIVIASLILCYQFITHSVANQNNKTDYAELNHVKYGLFNVGEWKKQINEILVKEINRLYLTRTDELAIKSEIVILLNTMIDEVSSQIRQANTGTVKGWIKQSFINTFVDMKDIKKGIPQYADALIQEMTTLRIKDKAKIMLNKQLKKYMEETFDIGESPLLKRILLRNDAADIKSARGNLHKTISVMESRIFIEAALLVFLSVILFAWAGLTKASLSPSRYIFLVISLIMLLAAGVTTPMIDMDAKISQLSFMLIGHPIQFNEQILYFQSKSILDVFWIMITHADFKMISVGVLMVIFSVIFPLLKIFSTMGYYYNFHNARDNPVIRFFVLKSGKWSMADVMVIAIFMAYIGFNGIVTSQLGELSSISQEVVIFTTNGTSLQPGYYLFFLYTLLALFLSGFLTRKPYTME
jgi:hypothetical protein